VKYTRSPFSVGEPCRRPKILRANFASCASWPLFEEALSKFPVLADIETARIRLARRFNSKRLPKQVEVDLAWAAHQRSAR
jgi:hypothetical protein